jgi:hypothetical protein
MKVIYGEEKKGNEREFITGRHSQQTCDWSGDVRML